MFKVAIIGGGVNGLTCGVKIKEKHKKCEVVLISDEFSPNTTGDSCGGLWDPYLVGDTPAHLVAKWGSETYKFIHQLWLEGGYDVSVLPHYDFYKENSELSRPLWADTVMAYEDIEEKELEYFNRMFNSNFRTGAKFTAFVVVPPTILKYLNKRFVAAGGVIKAGKVTSLQDPLLEGFDVVVNCSGLGAKEIVPDHTMTPIRGQIMKVLAPWVNITITLPETGHYIIPNANDCVLGGTNQVNDWTTEVRDADRAHIIDGCHGLIPGLKHATLVREWVGLRPGRSGMRVEPEEKDGRLYIHNYGHGGSGFTLFWGCGTEVLDIFDAHCEENENKFVGKSKL